MPNLPGKLEAIEDSLDLLDTAFLFIKNTHGEQMAKRFVEFALLDIGIKVADKCIMSK